MKIFKFLWHSQNIWTLPIQRIAREWLLIVPQILWPSHNIWTLYRQLFLPDLTISRAKPLVVINPCTSQWCFKTLATLTWRPCSRPISMTKKLRLMVVKVSLLRQGPLKIWTEHSPLSHFWNYNLKGDIGRTPETPFVILKI